MAPRKLTTNIVAQIDAEPDLSRARALACGAIDRRAEEVRLTYLTPGSGQAMAYLRKEARAREAQAVLDGGGSLNPADWPLLAGEIGATAPDLPQVVASIIAQAEAWEAVAAQIETVRLAGKAAAMAALDHASLVAELRGALAALDPLEDPLA